MKRKGILVVISGFSGAGKGTLVKSLLSKYDNYALSVSMTTRQPRPGEVHGVDYFYVDTDTFEKTIEADGLIEHAKYCDNYYGTPKAYVEEMLNKGKDVILEIEVQGALQIKEKYPDTLLLFVTTKDAESLLARLKGRGTETDEVIAKRMSRAVEEADLIRFYDSVIVNDDLAESTDNLHKIIDAAHAATNRSQELIAAMKADLTRLVKGE